MGINQYISPCTFAAKYFSKNEFNKLKINNNRLERGTKTVNIMETYRSNSNGVMDAGDHFKNGAILKSQTSRENKKSGVNMKSVLFTFSVVILSALFFFSCKKDKDDPTETFTVKEVVLNFGTSSGLNLKSVTVTNEKGNTVPFSDNPNNWFENSTLQSITVPAGTTISFGDFKLTTKLKFNFKVDGKDYTFGVGPGSKFVVQKTKTGKYKLLPEETFKLSPP